MTYDVPTIRCGTKDVPHNTVKWRSCTNRHPTTRGRSWGWIEGAPGNVYWSDDNQSFTSADAERVCREHNEWLENQKPIALRIIECNGRIETASAAVGQAQLKLSECQSKKDSEVREMLRLLEIEEAEKSNDFEPRHDLLGGCGDEAE